MKQYASFIFSFTIISLFAILGCKDEKTFSNVPVIKFKDFVKINQDSALMIISFTDGDGDVGIFSNDTASAPNLKMKYLYKNSSGNFVPYIDPVSKDTLYFNYRVPNLTPTGQNKSLEGDIEITLLAPYYVFDATPSHQTIQFEVSLRDRAGNKSNVATTAEIKVP